MVLDGPSIDVSGVGAGILRRIFSTKVLRDLSQFGTAPALASVVRMLQRRGQSLDLTSLSDLYEASYIECAQSKKIEYVYKNALVEKTILGRHSLRTASAMFEVSVGSSKLDALLFTTHASAYEIKTERDELGKLSAQIADYRKAFTRVWVFTSEKHVNAIQRQVPEDVGISILGSRYRIKILREARESANALEPSTMLRLLRKKELLEFIEKESSEIPNTKIFSEALEVANCREVQDLSQYVTRVLRGRALGNTALASVLPRNLGAVALALNLNSVQTARLIDVLKSPAARIV